MVLKTLLDLLYPPRCPFCRGLLSRSFSEEKFSPAGAGPATLAGVVCRHCAAELPWIEQGCLRCAAPLAPEEQECPYCRENVFSFQDCCALGSYRGKIKEAVHRFKYAGKKNLAQPLGLLLAGKISRELWLPSVEIIVPVPLYPEKLRERGYNQSLLLARVLGRELALPVEELLERVRDTRSQTGLNKKERAENLRRAFRCRQKLPPGSHILLVDDVLTSGATAHEAAKALQKAGAGRISVAVLAR